MKIIKEQALNLLSEALINLKKESETGNKNNEKLNRNKQLLEAVKHLISKL